MLFSPRTSQFVSLKLDHANSFHPEWQSRLRSPSLLFCQPPAAAAAAAAVHLHKTYHYLFLGMSFMQHRCFSIQGSDSRSCPAVRSDQGFFGVVGRCITANEAKRPILCTALLQKSLCCGNFLVAVASTGWGEQEAALASSMWPALRWRNAESLHLRQCGCKMFKVWLKKRRKNRENKQIYLYYMCIGVHLQRCIHWLVLGIL